jgi:hypothetical protein
MRETHAEGAGFQGSADAGAAETLASAEPADAKSPSGQAAVEEVEP